MSEKMDLYCNPVSLPDLPPGMFRQHPERKQSGYTAEVLYKGIVEKEISEQTAYTVTYVGEEVETGFMEYISVPFLIGFFLFDAAVIVAAVLLVRKLRKKNQEENDEEEIDDEKEGGTDAD